MVTGDFKVEVDGISAPFHPVKCHTLVTECTFSLPLYSWPKQDDILREINDWWAQNRQQGINSIIFAYSLGKAQRLLHNLDLSVGPVILHGAITAATQALSRSGLRLAIPPDSAALYGRGGALILAPPSAQGSPWLKRFNPYSTAMASGWMTLRGVRRRRATDRAFVISDHADWSGLNRAVTESGASGVTATHGYTAAFSRWCRERGLEAHELETLFTGESE